MLAALIQRTVKDWENPEFEWGEGENRRQFEIRELLIMEGHEVYEKLRYAVAEQLRDVGERKSTFALVGVLMGIHPDTMREIRRALFKEIIFLPHGGQDWLPLTKVNEGLAFKSQGEVYQLLARAVIVNFPDLLPLLGLALRLLLPGISLSPGSSAPTSSPAP